MIKLSRSAKAIKNGFQLKHPFRAPGLKPETQIPSMRRIFGTLAIYDASGSRPDALVDRELLETFGGIAAIVINCLCRGSTVSHNL